MRLSGSRSKSSSRSKSDDEDSPYKSLKLPLAFKDIDKILEYPTTTPKAKKTHLLSLFKDKIIEDEAARRLKAYLEDESVTDENVLLYRKIKQHINDNYLSTREYDPFMSQKEFKEKFKNKYYSKPYETTQVITDRIDGITGEADRLVREALLYSDFNKTADDFKKAGKKKIIINIMQLNLCCFN